MNIAGLSKAAVLSALYNASRPQGMGFLHYDSSPMSEGEARALLDSGCTRFDYLKGRVMKIDLTEDEVDTWGYNRDNGEKAAEIAVEALRHSGCVNASDIQGAHRAGKEAAIKDVERSMGERSTIEPRGDFAVMSMGLKDMEPVLRPAVERAKE